MPGRDIEPLIVRGPDLDDLLDHLDAVGRFAFDTEFVSEDSFEPILGLVQIATEERVVAIDPLAPGLDLRPLWEMVIDPSFEVVMHAAGEDLRIGYHWTGQFPERVFDTQIAAGLVGYSYPLSLTNLVNQTLGISLSGSETRTDWRRRPLSDAQVKYALDDVRYLLPIADKLSSTLARKSRTDWAEGEFREAIQVIRRRVEENRWRRLSGLANLNRRSLEVARRLSIWREDEARATNRPIRQIMRDDLLVGIAKRQPRNRKDLEALRDFNRPALLNRARELLDVIAEAQSVPDDELPAPFERFDDGPGSSMVASLLNATLAYCCAHHRLSPGLVGTTSDLKDLLRWHLDGRPEDARPELITGWRLDVCGQALLGVLEGRTAVRISDPSADVPVSLERLS
jgi:ribonuclease D